MHRRSESSSTDLISATIHRSATFSRARSLSCQPAGVWARRDFLRQLRSAGHNHGSGARSAPTEHWFTDLVAEIVTSLAFRSVRRPGDLERQACDHLGL